MLVQDMLTGQLHEVPDQIGGGMDEWPDPQLYGLGEVHDSYGNSLGLFFLPKLIQKAVGAVRRITSGGAPAPNAAMPCPPCPPCPSPPGWPGPIAMQPPMPGMPQPYPPPFAPRRRRRRR